MKGNAEFLVLFIPFLTVAIIAIYGTFFYPIVDILVNPLLVIIAQIILTLVGIFCIIVDVFALMVQYVNWKYYNEG
jgi:hypothetical protein